MTLRFACADVGVVCSAVTTAETEEADLVDQVRRHAREVHGVELNATLLDYAASKVTEVR